MRKLRAHEDMCKLWAHTDMRELKAHEDMCAMAMIVYKARVTVMSTGRQQGRGHEHG